MIDIKKILSTHGVPWVDRGGNVAKGNINIKCPICGPDDHSEHMGINPTTLQWGCWRNSKHRGKNIARLLGMLDIYISEDKSETLQKLINRTYFDATVNAEAKEVEYQRNFELPSEFISIANDSIISAPYLNYLRNKRGYRDDALEVAAQYDLRRSIHADKWATRLIIPIWKREEVTWTARAIGDNTLRYLSPNAEEALNIKQTIFNYNELAESEGDVLVVCEGPLDSLKVDYYNKPAIRATCLFGIMASEAQLKLLKSICTRYNNILIGLDEGTLAQSLILRKHLTDFSPSIVKLPAKDWGSMEATEANEIIDSYL